MNNGFILLSRTLLESDVFASQKLLKIWIWCLMKASYKDRSVPFKIGKGETIIKLKRGEFIFGRFKAEEELFIDGSTIYKSIQKLQSYDMIKIKSNNYHSIITICNYDTYQSVNYYQVTSKEQVSNNQVTSKEQVSNTYKKVKKDNKDNNIPAFNEFKNHVIEKCVSTGLEYNETTIKLKYDAWYDNGWKDGKNKPIKQWKSKITNTLKYILTEKTNSNTEFYKNECQLLKGKKPDLYIDYYYKLLKEIKTTPDLMKKVPISFEQCKKVYDYSKNHSIDIFKNIEVIAGSDEVRYTKGLNIGLINWVKNNSKSL